MFHLGPSGFCQCQSARIGHVRYPVDIFYCFSPKRSHYAQNMCLFGCRSSVSRVKLITSFERCDRHSPIVEFRKITFKLGIIEICKFSRCHDQRVAVLSGQLLASRCQSVSPAYECHIFGVRKQIVIGRHTNIIQFAPKDRLFSICPYKTEHSVEERNH